MWSGSGGGRGEMPFHRNHLGELWVRLEESEGSSHVDIWKKSSSRGKSRCEYLNMETFLFCSRNSKDTSATGQQWVGWRGQRDDGIGVERERQIDRLNCESLFNHCKISVFALSEMGGHCRRLSGSDLHFKMILLGAMLRMDYKWWQNEK